MLYGLAVTQICTDWRNTLDFDRFNVCKLYTCNSTMDIYNLFWAVYTRIFIELLFWSNVFVTRTHIDFRLDSIIGIIVFRVFLETLKIVF